MEVNMDYKTLSEFLIQELQNYKRMKGILGILTDDIGVQAQCLSDMPHSQTNKFSSVVENTAFQHQRNKKELKKDIKRIDICLSALFEDECFVIRQFYVENQTYNTISERWHNQTKRFYGKDYWISKRKKALKKMCETLNCIIVN
jgi:ArpU family phage transcriptional regulator